MFKKYKSKGLNVVGVNYGDTAAEVRDFRKEFKLTMTLAMGGEGEDSVSTTFGVLAYPTNYILDKDGKVVAQIIGYDEEAMLAALETLGIK